MNPEIQNTEPDILGYHLGLLDPDEARRVADLLVASPELQRRRADLADTLRPLDLISADAPDPTLAAKIAERVARSPRPPRAAARSVPLSGEEAGGRGRVVTLRELVGVAAAFALFASVFVPGMQRSRRQAEQMACLHNLGDIGRAHATYAAAFNDVLPYAGGPAARWGVTQADTGITPAGNSRNPFLLLKLGFVTPDKFICPRRSDTPLDASGIAGLSDFPDVRNVSYGSLMQTRPLQTHRLATGHVLMSDVSAQFDGRIIHQVETWNSNSHGHGAGQNVLKADGDVLWAPRPEVGPQGDNIFKIENINSYRGDETPRSPTDVFLFP